MRGKAAFVAGVAVGYVAGTRDGRERYVQIRSHADRLWHHPGVQARVGPLVNKGQTPTSRTTDGTDQEGAADPVPSSGDPVSPHVGPQGTLP
jgi:hypothetical protein